MKALNQYGTWVENEGEWVAYNSSKAKCEARGFATEASAWGWIHSNFEEDANGVTEPVTAEWFPVNINA